MAGLFITATDTGVGKTHIGCALVRVVRQLGLPIDVFKPVESGCLYDESGQLWPADALALQQAAGSQQPLEIICRYQFKTPLAPPEAARREGRQLKLQDLIDACHPLQDRGAFTLVEGAGGLYSPIADDALNIDLALALDLPMLLVCPDRLGTLSATLSAAENIHRRGGQLAAVLLNERPLDRNITPRPDNAGALKHWLATLLGKPVDVLALREGFENSLPWQQACRRWAGL